MSVSLLCQACALCCDGSLFGRVPLGGSDAQRAHAVHTPTGGAFLPQPCAALGGTRCTQYEQRPEACRRFECLLVGAVREGEVPLAEALELVARARERAKEAPSAAREAFFQLYFGRR